MRYLVVKLACQVAKYRSPNKCGISIILLATMSTQGFCLYYYKLIQLDNCFYNLYEYSDSLSHQYNKK